MYAVVEEANKLTVVYYLIAFFCKVFSIVDLLKEVIDWCGCIPT